MAYCTHCGAQVAEGAATCPNCRQPLPGSAKSSDKGVWVAVALGCGCLGVILMGIVAAILIPNLLDALQKAKQKRTLADVRTVGTAMMSWLSDELAEQSSDPGLPEEPTAEDLRRVLVPEYASEIPDGDGWGHPLEYRVNPDLQGSQVLRIRSPGRDGVFQTESDESVAPFLATDYDRDIVWADGYFLRYPEGSGRRPGG